MHLTHDLDWNSNDEKRFPGKTDEEVGEGGARSFVNGRPPGDAASAYEAPVFQ